VQWGPKRASEAAFKKTLTGDTSRYDAADKANKARKKELRKARKAATGGVGGAAGGGPKLS